jgi:hypothetical protein
MKSTVVEYDFICPVCKSKELKVLDLLPTYNDVLSVNSRAQIEFGDEAEHDWDGVEESFFMCGGCRRKLVVDGEPVSDACSLLRWFRGDRKEMSEPLVTDTDA